jgi:hypothetical protein
VAGAGSETTAPFELFPGGPVTAGLPGVSALTTGQPPASNAGADDG